MLDDIYEEGANSDDEDKKYRRMLASISSLSRKTVGDPDDCELILPNSFYTNGKLLLNLAEVK
jgi:hypothetical protein